MYLFNFRINQGAIFREERGIFLPTARLHPHTEVAIDISARGVNLPHHCDKKMHSPSAEGENFVGALRRACKKIKLEDWW